MSDLPTLHARVEAARALAAKATPGPWHVETYRRPRNQAQSAVQTRDGFVLAAEIEPFRSSLNATTPTMQIMALAPDLVTLATDLLALAESQAERIDSALCMLCEGPDAIGGRDAREQAIKILRGDK